MKWIVTGVVGIALAASTMAVCSAATLPRRQVLLPNGKPAVAAEVQLRSRNADGTLREVMVATDAGGYFELPTDFPRAKQSHLLIGYPGCALAFDVVFSFDTPITRSAIKLQPAYYVRGTVIDTAGRPVTGAEVGAIQITYWEADMCGNPIGIALGEDGKPLPQCRTITASDGSFALRGITHNGKLSLPSLQVRAISPEGLPSAAVHWEWGWRSRLKPTAAKITLRVSPTTLISGRVLDAATGEPLPGAGIRAACPTWPGAIVTDAAGRFCFEGLLSESATHYISASLPAPYLRNSTALPFLKTAIPATIDNITIELKQQP